MANGNGEMVKQWWPMILFFLGLAVTWGSSQSQLQALAEDVAEIKADDNTAHAESRRDQLKVKALETRQEAILQDVQEIKESQKEQSKKLDRIIQKLNESD